MWLENKTDVNIDRVAITLWPIDLSPLPPLHIKVNQLSFAGGQTTLVDDPPLGFHLYQLPQPFDAVFNLFEFLPSLPQRGQGHRDFVIVRRHALYSLQKRAQM